MNTLKKIVFYFLIGVILLTSCDWEINEDELTNKVIKTAVYTPLASGTVGLGNLLPTDDVIKLIGDDYYIVVNSESAEVNYASSSSLFGTNTMSSLNVNLPLPTSSLLPAGTLLPAFIKDTSITIVDSLKFWNSSTNPSVVVDSILINSCSFNFNITKKYSISNSKVYIEIVNSLKDSIDISSSNLTINHQINLGNKKIRIKKNQIKIKFTYAIKKNAVTYSGNDLKIALTPTTPDFKTIWGDFSNMQIDLPPGTNTEFNVPLPDFKDYKDIFTRASIVEMNFGLNYETTLGLKSDFALNIQQKKIGSSIYSNLINDVMTIKSATNESKLIDSTSLKIKDVGLDLEKLKMSGSFKVVKETGKANFVTFPFVIKYRPKIKIPLNLKLNNVSYNFTQAKPNIENLTFNYAILKIKFKNSLNVEVRMIPYLIKDKIVIDSITNNSIPYVLMKKTNNQWDSCSFVFSSNNIENFNKLGENDSLKFKLVIKSDSLRIKKSSSFEMKASIAMQGIYNLKK